MSVYSIAALLKEEEKVQLKTKYPFIHWGVTSKDIQTQLNIHLIELDIHPKMIDDLDMQLIELLLDQNSKQEIKVLMIRFQSIDLLKHEHIIKYIDQIAKRLNKNKIKLWIYPKQDQNYQQFVPLFQKMKSQHVSLVFNPAYVYLHRASVISSYKAFKKYIGCVVAEDVTTQNHPELIGYGQASLIELFKYMIKSSYQGDFMLDLKFDHYLEKLKKKQLGFFKILHKKDMDAYQLLKKRLKIDEKKDVQMIDIFDNQFEVLSIIFNLR
jgi:hypothetical protein